jgi:hypothetical protein
VNANGCSFSAAIPGVRLIRVMQGGHYLSHQDGSYNINKMAGIIISE